MSADYQPLPIRDVASRIDISPEHLIPYGNDKAKIALEAREAGGPPAKLILVSAITPTPAGEGKTTTSIGLAQGLRRIGERVAVALREPSLGPTFGMKGGAIGGGAARVIPSQDINLHFTGDFHAITSANNLLAAALDNHLHHGNRLGIDVRRVFWRRVMDMNDRALRNLVIGLGGVFQGVPRESGFDITPASEVMAVLCLSKDTADLRARLSRLIVAMNAKQEPITAQDLGAVGAMMVLLRDAIKPNLVQTLEGVPAFVHGGPFANIAHGCNSVIATRMAMAYSDWTVTEAGFGFDLGGEKFLDIKCTKSGLAPSAIVLVATIRALKMHGGIPKDQLTTPDPGAVERGLCNLEKHIENAGHFGFVPIVALNRFSADQDEEIAVVKAHAQRLGVPYAESDHFGHGGQGAEELARTVVAHARSEATPVVPLYEASDPIKTKIEKVAKKMYGAGSVVYGRRSVRDLKKVEAVGMSDLPLCMAKTPNSLSDNPRLVGRPEGFEVTVQGFELAAGAGFLIPLLGDIMRMPGLPKRPALEDADLVDGEIVGLK